MNHSLTRWNFHDEVHKILKKMSSDRKCGQIVLVYGFGSQIPFIEIRSDALSIPIAPPKSYIPYSSWSDFMKNYIEAQVALVAEELKITVYHLTTRNELLPLIRSESLLEGDLV